MRWMGFRWPLWDMIVFAKVKSALGGRVRWMVSGAAPLSAQVHHFLQVMKLLDHVSLVLLSLFDGSLFEDFIFAHPKPSYNAGKSTES